MTKSNEGIFIIESKIESRSSKVNKKFNEHIEYTMPMQPCMLSDVMLSLFIASLAPNI